jgi:hypothetical protein
VVDNDSKDTTWDRLQILLNLFPGRVKIVKNPFNFGAAGSLALNLELIETDWFCSLHQDDDYFSSYVKNFNQIIDNVEEEVVTVSAEMGSITNAGSKVAVPPRSSWVLRGSDTISALIANLRVQTVPFPASAFRTNIYRQCISPWHSTGFSDTESTLFMLEFGNFMFSKANTMNYRENEMSESHSINNHESLLSTGASLSRVFSSSVFAKLVRVVRPEDRYQFLESLNKSIEIRLGNSEFSKFMKYLAAENCMVAWGYSEASSINQVRSYFTDSGSTFTPHLLAGILDFLGEPGEEPNYSQSIETNNFLNSFLGSLDSNVNLRNQKSSLTRKFYNSLVKLLPFKIQKNISTFIIKLKLRLTENHPWDFKWR